MGSLIHCWGGYSSKRDTAVQRHHRRLRKQNKMWNRYWKGINNPCFLQVLNIQQKQNQISLLLPLQDKPFISILSLYQRLDHHNAQGSICCLWTKFLYSLRRVYCYEQYQNKMSRLALSPNTPLRAQRNKSEIKSESPKSVLSFRHNKRSAMLWKAKPWSTGTAKTRFCLVLCSLVCLNYYTLEISLRPPPTPEPPSPGRRLWCFTAVETKKNKHGPLWSITRYLSLLHPSFYFIICKETVVLNRISAVS